MNATDRKEFDLIHQKIDNITQSIDEMKQMNDKQHSEVHQDIRFIKENLFNPHQGLWAETKLNTQFRQDTKKWRSVMGTGFIGLLLTHVWNMFSK